jgi:hypothetical protein
MFKWLLIVLIDGHLNLDKVYSPEVHTITDTVKQTGDLSLANNSNMASGGSSNFIS